MMASMRSHSSLEVAVGASAAVVGVEGRREVVVEEDAAADDVVESCWRHCCCWWWWRDGEWSYETELARAGIEDF